MTVTKLALQSTPHDCQVIRANIRKFKTTSQYDSPSANEIMEESYPAQQRCQDQFLLDIPHMVADFTGRDKETGLLKVTGSLNNYFCIEAFVYAIESLFQPQNAMHMEQLADALHPNLDAARGTNRALVGCRHMSYYSNSMDGQYLDMECGADTTFQNRLAFNNVE